MWRAYVDLMEVEQRNFLNVESHFRNPEYNWPRDALHNWSRIWEYPYVYHQLKFYRREFSDSFPLIVDFGGGVTFFPFLVAKLGYRIVCTDIDPICEKDLKKACNLINCEPGYVEFRLISEETVTFR